MNLDDGFDQLQGEVNADPAVVATARERRDLFRGALGDEEEILRVSPSGSLARGSQIEPINDVDVVAVFEEEEHSGWGEPGSSAEEALQYVRDRVHALLGVNDGTVAHEVRLVRLQNHAIKCFLDDPDDPDAFTVDVAPALPREAGGLWIPERNSRQWIATDPEYLIDKVAERHAAWRYFVPLVRVLKRWNRDSGAGLKSLVVEVLALMHMPANGRPRALAEFFAAATSVIGEPVDDPAGLCGEIQPNLDVTQARACLDHAAELAWRAVTAQDDGDTDRAACLWRELLGDIFPEPLAGCADSSGLVAGLFATTPRRQVRDAPQG